MRTVWEAAGLRSGERAALIGSGGKTTLLYRLGREAPGNWLLTTTTRMFPPDPGRVDHILDWLGREDFLARWRTLRPRRAFVARQGEGKLSGLSPEEVDFLANLEDLHFLAVEADGSRQMPAKAHAPYEPVLFSRCTVGFAVLGMRALGRAIAPGQVHRPEIVARVTGQHPGSRLGAESLARLLVGPAGYLERLEAPRKVVVLTQVDDPAREVAARAVALEARAASGVTVLGLGAALAGELEVLA